MNMRDATRAGPGIIAGLLAATLLVGQLPPVAAQPAAAEAAPPIICGDTWGQYMGPRLMGTRLWSHAGWSDGTATAWANYLAQIGGLDGPSRSTFATGLTVGGAYAEHALRWLEEAFGHGDATRRNHAPRSGGPPHSGA